MAHLGEIEKQLNTDPKIRQEFLKDPVGFLMARGIILSPEQAQSVRDFCRRTTTASTPVAGASVGQKGELKLVIRSFIEAQR